MNWLKIVAILLVVDAIVILFRPDFVKKYAALVAEGAKIYLAAIIKTVLGVIFLFGADKCTYPWVIITFGILALVGAVFIVAVPQKSRAMAAWAASKSTFTLRFFGLIYLLIGALLVYSS
ncbi:MAG: DUF2065 family protein [Phycisphaerae bacterium]|jgi:uncharacterized protein YjeT (DUF2065 family)